MNSSFEIPVVLFFFKRADLTLRILEQVRKVKPQKLYLFSDGGRNETEWELVRDCRERIEAQIDWDCEVIKNYAEKNRGVYESIGNGARWVFEREKWAIFLEDDNLPETTFFSYCKEMLEKYEKDSRILWVCGTNYLEKYQPSDGASYVFTQHLLPCGWASWSDKFLIHYDGNLDHLYSPGVLDKVKYSYMDKALFNQQLYNFKGTYEKLRNSSPVSWDHQMCFSIRANSLYGIAPNHNQIRNIGVDERSTHGGSSMKKTMTRRFCGMDSHPMEFPLKHPTVVNFDPVFEKKTGNIILYPLGERIIYQIVRAIKPLFGYGKYESVSVASLKAKLINARRKE